MGSAEIILLIGLLLAGTAVYLFVSAILEGSGEAAQLSWASEEAPVVSRSKFIEFSRPFAHRFAMNLALKVTNKAYRKNIEHSLRTAGLNRELNVDEFLALQILWGIIFPIALAVLNFGLQMEIGAMMFIMICAFGFFFPHIYCKQERETLRRSILIDLPFFIDILALSTEAGLDFIGAIQRVVEKAEGSPLAAQFDQVIRDTKLGRSRKEALVAMAERLDMSEVSSFIAVLVDADSTGASIGTVLKQQSAQMRLERFSRAEKMGARASQAMLIPLMFIIMPAVFIMVFGPVVLQMMGQGGK